MSIGTIKTHILCTDSRMHDLEGRIKEAVDAVMPKAASAIEATDIDIIVGIDPASTIPETGVGGSTRTPHIICIWIDPEHGNVKENVEDEVKSTVAHELHHAMRNRVYPWPGTLLEDMVGEGLADHFDLEINGRALKPWTTALSEEQLQKMYERAQPLFHQKGNGYPNWLFGSKEEQIPKWTGYALGFKIVGDYLGRTGKKASELVQVDPEECIKRFDTD